MYFFSDVPSGLRSKLVSKLQDLNSSAPPGQALTDSEFDCIVSLAATLENTSRYHSSEMTSADVAAAMKMLHWSSSNLAIPFDLMRMLASHPHGAGTLARHSQFKTVLGRIAGLFADSSLPVTVSTVMLRFLVNSIRDDSLIKACLYNEENAKILSNIVEASKAYIVSGNKNYRLSLGSLLANIAVALGDIPTDKVSSTSELYFRVKSTSRVLLQSDPIIDIVLICAFSLGTLAFYGKQRNIMPELLSDLTIVTSEFLNVNDSWRAASQAKEVEDILAEMRSLA